ncbi:MAG: XdhC family protein [Deltaproteobacteria bacterium]|nr:XdhC family protein [Deltaproteobacteria bacterium]
MKHETLEAILAARAERRPIVRLVWLESGEERLLTSAAELTTADPALAAAIESAFADDDGGLVETASGPVFVQPFNPPPRLAIVGAVHIAQSLAVLARDLGHAVTVIDPRRGFLTEARFPGVAISHAWPDEALESFGLDPRSAVVTLSHDSKLDDPALHTALRSNAYYIGALGSQRTQVKRRARLAEAGFDAATIARIHGPVGLDIGAGSPAEIALSIAAEIVACLRRKK